MTDASTVPSTADVVADEDALDRLFRPPAEIRAVPEWEQMYEALVRGLRRDAAGLPLDMAQRTLIERVASSYIRVAWHQFNGGMSATQIEKMNDTYLKYVTQFQKVLAASDEVLRQDLLQKVQNISVQAVELIRDPEDRKAVRRHFRDNFAELGY